ncbi:hypothetical protein LJB42_001317 [Komagataella kurtzmanii]|nr:hypothetical protein LJB42_001317 [Komagataella kurtzmanii]
MSAPRGLATVSPLSRKWYDLSQKAIEQGKPHFRLGQKKIYFPSARVILLRPNAKHTPYQAKFVVPKSFNKLDLRDYLYHIYGLRAFNITTQLLHGKFTRSLPMPFRARRRSPQIKKMTIDMQDPFVWPDPQNSYLQDELDLSEESKQYFQDRTSPGADKNKRSLAFGGIIDPEPAAENFVPKKLSRQMKNKKQKALEQEKRQSQEELIRQYISL